MYQKEEKTCGNPARSSMQSDKQTGRAAEVEDERLCHHCCHALGSWTPHCIGAATVQKVLNLRVLSLSQRITFDLQLLVLLQQPEITSQSET